MKKDKKPPKISNKEFDREREFTVILEKVYSEIKLIGEGQTALGDKLDATMGMVAKNREDLTFLSIKSEGIKNDLTKINGKLAKIEDDLRIIKTDFGKRLSELEATK